MLLPSELIFLGVFVTAAEGWVTPARRAMCEPEDTPWSRTKTAAPAAHPPQCYLLGIQKLVPQQTQSLICCWQVNTSPGCLNIQNRTLRGRCAGWVIQTRHSPSASINSKPLASWSTPSFLPPSLSPLPPCLFILSSLLSPVFSSLAGNLTQGLEHAKYTQ